MRSNYHTVLEEHPEALSPPLAMDRRRKSANLCHLFATRAFIGPLLREYVAVPKAVAQGVFGRPKV